MGIRSVHRGETERQRRGKQELGLDTQDHSEDWSGAVGRFETEMGGMSNTGPLDLETCSNTHSATAPQM